MLVGVLGWWLVMGANRGWTKTSIALRTMDQVTGIEGVAYEKRFVPGLELLVVGGLSAIALFGLSFLFKPQKK